MKKYLFLCIFFISLSLKGTADSQGTKKEEQETQNNESLKIKLNLKSTRYFYFGISENSEGAELKPQTNAPYPFAFYLYVNNHTSKIIFSFPEDNAGWVLKPKDPAIKTVYQALKENDVKEIDLTLGKQNYLKIENGNVYDIGKSRKYIFFGKKQVWMKKRQETKHFLYRPLSISGDKNAKKALKIEFICPYLTPTIIERLHKKNIATNSECSVTYPKNYLKKVRNYEEGSLTIRPGLDIAPLTCVLADKSKLLKPNPLKYQSGKSIKISWDTHTYPEIWCWENPQNIKLKKLPDQPNFIINADEFTTHLTPEETQKIQESSKLKDGILTLEIDNKKREFFFDKNNNLLIQNIQSFFNDAKLTIKIGSWELSFPIFYLDVS